MIELGNFLLSILNPLTERSMIIVRGGGIMYACGFLPTVMKYVLERSDDALRSTQILQYRVEIPQILLYAPTAATDE